MIRKLIIANTVIALLATSAPSFSNPVATMKKGYDTYLSAKSILEEPRNIIALKLKIDGLYQNEANYEGLSNELLIKAGKLAGDTDPNDLLVSTFDIDGNAEAGYKIKLTKVTKDTCKQFLKQLKNTKFIKKVDIYDDKEKKVESCQSNSWFYGGNNTVVFSQEYGY